MDGVYFIMSYFMRFIILVHLDGPTGIAIP